MLVDHTNRRVLDVLEGRGKELIVKYLRQNKGGLFAQLEEVTTDMWDGYVNAAEEVFKESVRVTIDRFHVMKNFQEQLTEARREIQRGLGKEAAKELKGTRWLWQTNPENLTAEQRQQLESLKGLDAFCKTLTNWLDKIANYFVSRSSNGRTEGFNHALRSILWRAFGMTNFSHFRLRALHRFGRPANA